MKFKLTDLVTVKGFFDAARRSREERAERIRLRQANENRASTMAGTWINNFIEKQGIDDTIYLSLLGTANLASLYGVAYGVYEGVKALSG